MTKHKQTKRALISSMLSLVLCFTMLLGTTFAWFTDSAKTSVNKIQSGTLDVALLDTDGNSLEGGILSWKKAEGHENEEILWEPGATYELQPIVVKNNGNLALKYKVAITGIKGDAKLNEVIEWTAKVDSFDTSLLNETIGSEAIGTEYSMLPDEYDVLYISGHMKEEAGREYMNLSIEGIAITVVATQYTYESDSYSDQYDENATYDDVWDGVTITAITPDADGVYHITSAAEFAWLMAQTQNGNSPFSGKTFILARDIDFDGRTISGVGSASANISFTFDGNGHTIKNFTINNSTEFYSGLFNQLNGTVKNLNVENATVIGNKMVGVIASNVDGGVIEDCHVKNSTVIANVKKAGAITGYAANGTSIARVTGCSATNVNVYCADAGVNESGEIVGYENAGSTVENNCATNVNVYRNTTPELVSTAEELVAFANAVNVSSNSYAGKFVVLTSDIDLTGIDWTPIANDQRYFNGVFDGQNHTISNLTINDTTIAAGHATAFIGRLSDGTIKNVTFDNANVKGYHNVAVAVGYNEFGSVENVKVTNSNVTAECKATTTNDEPCGDKAGAVVGFVGSNPQASVTNCHAENCTVTAGRDAGQIIGMAYPSQNTLINNTASNVTVVATGECTGANITNDIIGR